MSLTTKQLSWKILYEQLPTIRAMATGGLLSQLPTRKPGVDGKVLTARAKAPSDALLAAYNTWSGAAQRHAGTVPPHLVCAKITMPLVARLTARAPYPMLSVLNQGLRLTLNTPLPAGEKIYLSGSLVDILDDGYRARFHSQIQVGTESIANAMTVDAMATVVLKKRPAREQTGDATVEPSYETVGQWQARAEEGQVFFWLTGDFNPIHTWPAMAKKTRFKGCIMHGYGAFAQVYEALLASGAEFNLIETRFIQPLPLPSPTLLIQRTPQPDDEGKFHFRLTDDNGTLYQAGYYQQQERPA